MSVCQPYQRDAGRGVYVWNDAGIVMVHASSVLQVLEALDDFGDYLHLKYKKKSCLGYS